MKKLLLSLFVAGFTLSAFCQKTETRAVSGFTGIDASSAFEITVTKGNTESLTVEADENAMPYVRSEVKQGVLHLYLDNNKKVRNIKTLKATVVMKNLEKVSLSGACKLTGNGTFTPDAFSGNCSGASHFDLHLNTGQMTVKTSGASKINLHADVAGKAKFDMSGASKLNVELKAVDVQFYSSGSNKLEITGSASDILVDVSGASNISAGDFSVNSASVKSSGSCSITLNVAETLNVNSSGASSVHYKGSPVINAKTSGASKIRQL